MEFSKRKFVFYLVVWYLVQGLLFTYFYYQMERWEELGEDEPIPGDSEDEMEDKDKK